MEHVDSKDSFITKLEEMKRGVRAGGIILLVVNSDVREINAETSEDLEPQFEVNLPTAEMQTILSEAFHGFHVIKKSVVAQEYDIPRENTTSRLSTNVITFVVSK